VPDRLEITHRAEAVSALARAIEAGYDVDAIVDAARKQQSGKEAITTWPTAQLTNGDDGRGGGVPPFDSSPRLPRVSPGREFSPQNPEGDPGPLFSEWSVRRSV
jgi:hypothetical protein